MREAALGAMREAAAAGNMATAVVAMRHLVAAANAITPLLADPKAAAAYADLPPRR